MASVSATNNVTPIAPAAPEAPAAAPANSAAPVKAASNYGTSFINGFNKSVKWAAEGTHEKLVSWLAINTEDVKDVKMDSTVWKVTKAFVGIVLAIPLAFAATIGHGAKWIWNNACGCCKKTPAAETTSTQVTKTITDKDGKTTQTDVKITEQSQSTVPAEQTQTADVQVASNNTATDSAANKDQPVVRAKVDAINNNSATATGKGQEKKGKE